MFATPNDRCKSQVRYLGPLLSDNGRGATEFESRTMRTMQAWNPYAYFWNRKCDLGLKVLLFKAIIINTLFNGLEAFVINEGENEKLVRKIMVLARK